MLCTAVVVSLYTLSRGSLQCREEHAGFSPTRQDNRNVKPRRDAAHRNKYCYSSAIINHQSPDAAVAEPRQQQNSSGSSGSSGSSSGSNGSWRARCSPCRQWQPLGPSPAGRWTLARSSPTRYRTTARANGGWHEQAAK